MTLKITKTGRGVEQGDETLLFEWLDHESPESITYRYETNLNTSKYAGSLQTNQILGIYLEPIVISGNFFSTYITKNDGNTYSYATAKQRSDELSRLQGRIVKFWYEGIKQLVIIKSYEITFKNLNNIDYNLVLQPHDIQLPIKPDEVKEYLEKSFIQATLDVKPPSSTQFEGQVSVGTLGYQPSFRDKNVIQGSINNNNELINFAQSEIESNNKLINIFRNDRTITNAQRSLEINKLTNDSAKLKQQINDLQKENEYDKNLLKYGSPIAPPEVRAKEGGLTQ